MYGEVGDVKLIGKSKSKNDLGEIEKTWDYDEPLEEFPGRLSQLSAEQRYESNRYTGIVEWRLYADIKNVDNDIERGKYQIQYGDVVYKIESVNDVDKLGKRYQIDLLRTD